MSDTLLIPQEQNVWQDDDILKMDLHLHPLCHKYYHTTDKMEKVTLDEQDQEWIRAMVHWSIDRGMNVISITDHDMLQSSLYAKEYVIKNNLPIIIIPGAELEVRFHGEYCHILALGLENQPNYKMQMSMFPRELIDIIHQMGGKAIMSHPKFSHISFVSSYDILDGYEFINSGIIYATEAKAYLKEAQFSLDEYANSDFHYDPTYPGILETKNYPKSYNEIRYADLKEIFGKWA